MISLLKSRFDRLPCRALFLSADKLAAYHWVNGKLGSSYLFDVSKDGQQYFDRYLKETGRISTWFLVDLIEEEYKHDTIPHVLGADKEAVISRKKARLFRDTPYFHADIQEREADGRRDDRILFMALTNPDLITPWLEILEANKIPLAGIYSVPQLTKFMLNQLPDPVDHMLVISLQSISGLRQSFFLKNQLKISRLVNLPRYGTTPYAPIINEEVEIIRRYLNSMRFINAEKPLHIYYLSENKLLGEVKKLTENTAAIKHIYINSNLFAQQTGLNREITTPFSDELFIYQLLKQKPSNLYAEKDQTRYFQMQKMGRLMYASSLLLVLTGIIWGGFNFLNAVVYKQQSEIASKKADFYNARYQMAKEKLPVTPVSPQDLKLIVDIADTLNKYKADPFSMLKKLSSGLSQYPQIQVDRITWVATADPNTKIMDTGKASTDQGVVGVSNIASKDSGYNYYQVAAISGHINSFDGNYRAALNMINQFAETLRSLESIYNVSIVTLPLDISSDASLQGATDTGPSAANFSVRVVLGIKNEG